MAHNHGSEYQVKVIHEDGTEALSEWIDARHTASPWQATAMDRVKPLLKEIAANTETVIQYINKNQISARSNKCKEQEWR